MPLIRLGEFTTCFVSKYVEVKKPSFGPTFLGESLGRICCNDWVVAQLPILFAWDYMRSNPRHLSQQITEIKLYPKDD